MVQCFQIREIEFISPYRLSLVHAGKRADFMTDDSV